MSTPPPERAAFEKFVADVRKTLGVPGTKRAMRYEPPQSVSLRRYEPS